MFAFNVYLNNKLIDTVWYQVGKRETIAEAIENTRNSLINHDCYDPGINVVWPKGQRLTVTSYDLEANYGYGHGFEVITSGETYREVKQNLKEYRENGDHAPMRIVKRLTRK